MTVQALIVSKGWAMTARSMGIYLFTIFYQGSPFNKSWFPIGPWDKNIYNHYKSTLYNNKKANT